MESIKTIVLKHKKDQGSLLEMIRDVQAAHGHIPGRCRPGTGPAARHVPKDVQGVVTFYHFFSLSPGENTPSISTTRSRPI